VQLLQPWAVQSGQYHAVSPVRCNCRVRSTQKVAVGKVGHAGAALQPVDKAVKCLLAMTLQHHVFDVRWGCITKLVAGYGSADEAAWVQLLQDAV
jgi:hypothetical protein